ncbi:DNA-processing protein DprA [Bacillus sp. EAC]|uniref:DNA-processing protein DprA n=1 Tax=Bacillus sp. EAC TaxID=1978338 RepID=UPI000B452468|nr:DNA-processing protein DprA [Bacillus sp. EAC]
MNKENRLIHLNTCLFDNYLAMSKILQFDPELKDLYRYSPSFFKSTFHLTAKSSEKLYRQLHSISISDILDFNVQNNSKFITIYSDMYPELLKQIYDPPFVLYLKGDINLLKSDFKLSIIGSRKPSKFANLTCDSFVKELVKENWIIVSGMALGCDTLAHKAAMHHGGKTIAVIGSGLNTIYPKANSYLFNEMISNHLVISEYPHYIQPEKRYFPRRNRIIAGLSKGLIILEAKEKSGTMITANFALENGREVFAVPGPIIMDEYKGSNQLIQEGAKLITCSKDIIEEFIDFA